MKSINEDILLEGKRDIEKKSRVMKTDQQVCSQTHTYTHTYLNTPFICVRNRWKREYDKCFNLLIPEKAYENPIKKYS